MTEAPPLRKSMPIDFTFQNSSGEPVLSTLLPHGQPMWLSIKNVSSGDLTLPNVKAPEPVSNLNAHFTLRFKAGTLENLENIRVEGPGPGNWRWSTNTGLELGRYDEVYLVAPSKQLVLKPRQLSDLKLTGVKPKGDRGARSSQVELTYQRFNNHDVRGTRLCTISIINAYPSQEFSSPGTANKAPMVAGHAGASWILNDDKTPNTLNIQLTSTDPKRSILFAYNHDDAKAAAIFIEFDVETGDPKSGPKQWALCTEGQAAGVSAYLNKEKFVGPTGTGLVSLRWSPLKASLIILPNASKMITFNSITSSQPSGMCSVRIRYQNLYFQDGDTITAIEDGVLVVPVMKSPLVFGKKNAAIGGYGAGNIDKLDATLTVFGTLRADTVQTNSDMNIGRSLRINNDTITNSATVESTLAFGKPKTGVTRPILRKNKSSLALNTSFEVDGKLSLGNDLKVGASASINNSLSVKGTSRFSNSVRIDGVLESTSDTLLNSASIAKTLAFGDLKKPAERAILQKEKDSLSLNTDFHAKSSLYIDRKLKMRNSPGGLLGLPFYFRQFTVKYNSKLTGIQKTTISPGVSSTYWAACVTGFSFGLTDIDNVDRSGEGNSISLIIRPINGKYQWNIYYDVPESSSKKRHLIVDVLFINKNLCTDDRDPDNIVENVKFESD